MRINPLHPPWTRHVLWKVKPFLQFGLQTDPHLINRKKYQSLSEAFFL